MNIRPKPSRATRINQDQPDGPTIASATGGVGSKGVKKLPRKSPGAGMPKPHLTGPTMGENKIFGHDWEDIQRAQQGGRLHKRLDTSKPIDHSPTEDDLALHKKHGSIKALQDAGFHGTVDRLVRSGIKENVAMSAGGAGDPGQVQNPTSNYAFQVLHNKVNKKLTKKKK